MRFIRNLNFGICPVLLLLIAFTSGSLGQLTKNEFLKQMAATASEAELTALRNGNILVKVLPSRDKREVSVLGAVKLRDVQDIDLARFRSGLSQKNNKAVLGGGILSPEPSLQDLAELTLDDRDVEKLKTCSVGDCDLKLSASIIRRFATEIDWNATEHKVRATELFKTLLIDYVRDYLKRGDRALIEYADKRKPVRLADEYRAITEGSVLVRGLAPELLDYLKKFPTAELPGAESRVDWSKVDSGLKPIITLTHSVGYSRQLQDDLFLTIATKQIYASHYIDASMAFTSLLRFGSGESAEEYLLFTSTSRSDSLGGALSRMAHAVVEREALQKAEELLQNSKMRLEAKAPATQKTADHNNESGIYTKIVELSESLTVRILAVLFIALALFLAFRWKRGK
ncbi:MAG: hypothetical protein IPO41_04325 [Acidobacteria bacterium]|nr:hypothetical protein [Acidobacteriota bacterium]MBP7474049.1 hypothetical protein [Pyrinomonadaceae bacterium]MBP9109879.1 hypothetical protein [Pyrinomonadaceae bacterium]